MVRALLLVFLELRAAGVLTFPNTALSSSGSAVVLFLLYKGICI
jgi:hypothetical protein